MDTRIGWVPVASHLLCSYTYIHFCMIRSLYLLSSTDPYGSYLYSDEELDWIRPWADIHRK